MNKQPLIIGHRGARKYAPENSISAFKKAIDLELDGVEFDVMSTLDGVPVVIHDDNLSQLTGRNIHLHKIRYDDIFNIDIGNSFSPYFSGERIPTLKEVLDLFKDTNLILNIELKTQPHQHKNFLAHVLEIIHSFPDKDRILTSSFDKWILYKIGRLAPDIKRALLLRPKAFFFLDALIFANMLAVHGINPHIAITNRFLIKYAKAKRWQTVTWTANDEDDIKKAVELKADGIITDEPMLVREIINIYG